MNAVFARIEKIVTSADGLRWLQLVYRLNENHTLRLDESTIDELVALEICNRVPGVAMTRFGSKCADSAREYLFWIERQSSTGKIDTTALNWKLSGAKTYSNFAPDGGAILFASPLLRGAPWASQSSRSALSLHSSVRPNQNIIGIHWVFGLHFWY